MKVDDEITTAPDDDLWLRSLRALPHEDLDASRTERLRQRAHAELARAATPWRIDQLLEPLFFAGCAVIMLARIVFVIMTVLKTAA